MDGKLVKVKNSFFKNSYLNIWMSNKRKFPLRFIAIFVCHYFKKPQPRVLKPIPDFADEVNEIIWRLEGLFFVKKKPYVNPEVTKAGKYIMDNNRAK